MVAMVLTYALLPSVDNPERKEVYSVVEMGKLARVPVQQPCKWVSELSSDPGLCGAHPCLEPPLRVSIYGQA